MKRLVAKSEAAVRTEPVVDADSPYPVDHFAKLAKVEAANWWFRSRNRLLSWLSRLQVSDQIGNLRIFSRKVAQAYHVNREQFRLLPAIVAQVGFEPIRLALPRAERSERTSSYTHTNLFKLAYETVLSHSEKPLQNFAMIGAPITFLSLSGSIIYFSLGSGRFSNLPKSLFLYCFPSYDNVGCQFFRLL